MADAKVSDLQEATSLSNNDLLYVVDDGASKKIKYSNFKKGFTLKNVDLGGLPASYNTTDEDGGLILYKAIQDDGMTLEDVYFSIGTTGFYVMKSNGRYAQIDFDEFVRSAQFFDFDDTDYSFQFWHDSGDSPHLVIGDIENDKYLKAGTNGLFLTDDGGNLYGGVNEEALRKLMAFNLEDNYEDFFFYDIVSDYTSQYISDFKAYFESKVWTGSSTSKQMNFGTMGMEYYVNGTLTSQATPQEIGYLSGVTGAIQTQLNSKANESEIDATPVTVTGNPITITDAANIPCESLVMTIEPTQSGSGTPSPSNIRPFVGKTDATAQTTNGTDTNTAMVTFGQTLYNAIIDFTKGTATLLWKVGKVQYLAKNTGNYFYSDNVVGGSNDVTIVCDRVNTKSTPDYNSETGAFLNVYGVFSIVTPESYSTGEEALAAYGGEINVLYELPTPEIIQLTPAQLTLLKGNNTVSGDGVTITLDYQKDNVVGDIKKWVLEQISALS